MFLIHVININVISNSLEEEICFYRSKDERLQMCKILIKEETANMSLEHRCWCDIKQATLET